MVIQTALTLQTFYPGHYFPKAVIQFQGSPETAPRGPRAVTEGPNDSTARTPIHPQTARDPPAATHRHRKPPATHPRNDPPRPIRQGDDDENMQNPHRGSPLQPRTQGHCNTVRPLALIRRRAGGAGREGVARGQYGGGGGVSRQMPSRKLLISLATWLVPEQGRLSVRSSSGALPYPALTAFNSLDSLGFLPSPRSLTKPSAHTRCPQRK